MFVKHDRRAMLAALGAGLGALGLLAVGPASQDVLGQTAPTDPRNPTQEQRARLAVIRQQLGLLDLQLGRVRGLRGVNRRDLQRMRLLLRQALRLISRLLVRGPRTVAELRRIIAQLNQLAVLISSMAVRLPVLQAELRAIADRLREVVATLGGTGGAAAVAASGV